MDKKTEVTVGMLLAEECRVKFGSNPFRIRIHEVVRVMPSGRFETDLGFECNRNYTVRGTHGLTKLRPITAEIREKIEHDQVVDELKQAVHDLDKKRYKLEKLNTTEAKLLLTAVTKILNEE